MKKFLRSTLAVCLLLCMMLGLTACGGTPLTEENAVGSYKLARMIYTASEDNTGGYQSCDYTESEYQELVARIEAGTATAKDENDYNVVGGFEVITEVRMDGSIFEVYEDSPSLWIATWKIEDGKFVYICEIDKIDEYSGKWDNGKIIVTHTVSRSDPYKGEIVCVYEKISRNVELTAENLVGNYRAVFGSFTPNADNTEYTTPYSVNRNSYNYAASKAEQANPDAEYTEKYEIFAFAFDGYFTVTADGKVLGEGNFHVGNWEINDGKLVYTEIANTIDQFSAKWDNGRIVMTVNLVYSYGPQGTLVFTLEKATLA